MNGWVSIHRKLLDWEWYSDSQTVHLFLHLLLKANHADGSWQGRKILRGQIITGRKVLSAETGISEQSIRTRLRRLEKSGEINQQTNQQYTIITINKYNDYQTTDEFINQQTNQQLTRDQPTTNQQLTTNNKENKENKENNTAAAAKKKKGMGIAAVRNMRPDWWTADEWNELIDYRSSVKATQSVRAYNSLLTEFEFARTAGDTPQDILDDITQGKGWAGYKWEWVRNRRGRIGQNCNATAVNSSANKNLVTGDLRGKNYNEGATEREKLPDCLKA